MTLEEGPRVPGTHLIQDQPDWRTAPFACGAYVGTWTRDIPEVSCPSCVAAVEQALLSEPSARITHG